MLKLIVLPLLRINVPINFVARNYILPLGFSLLAITTHQHCI